MIQIYDFNAAVQATREGSLGVLTHSGAFHADDVAAVATLGLRQTLGGLPQIALVRSRDPRALALGFIKVDVGGVYDPAKEAFDHHQKGGAGTRPNGVPYSSFGLVWKHYGLEVVARLGEERKIDGFPGLTDKQAQAVWESIDAGLVQAIDAVDNGAAEGGPVLKGTTQRVAAYSISQAIHSMNPPAVRGMRQDFDEGFLRAVTWFKTVLSAAILAAGAEEIARDEVRKAMSLQAGPVLILDQFVDWQETVVSEGDPGLLYVIFRNPEGTWMIQQIPKALGTFEGRKALPAAWAGLRDAELQKASDVADAVFCHNGRFIAGARSKEGAVAMAQKAVMA